MAKRWNELGFYVRNCRWLCIFQIYEYNVSVFTYIVYTEVVRRFLMFLFGFWNMIKFSELLIFVIFFIFIFLNYIEELTRMKYLYSILFNYRACIAKSVQLLNTSVYDFFILWNTRQCSNRFYFMAYTYIDGESFRLFKEYKS